ncbi:biotin-dependent carboxyltransferase family protein [uncultured Polaribacter sp.]|uniref:5-oxoprolinase subunit C family protein n=1 Tax=uncultured Polaribacter sp. TaxID=174711 RepID=UPI002629EAAB|nr:biotin-dependent carboxyltransferase family protein [uncultured Polaribacter sp.]
MIKVLKAGFYSSIQDRGRVGFASNGVPVSGVMDAFSADLANSILNNSLKDAVLEITFGGCELQFLTATNICISGGDFSPTINKKPIKLNANIKVEEGAILSFGKIHFGVRCYLAVQKGFQTEKILNSRSFYQNITKNTRIQKGDLLPLDKNISTKESATSSLKPIKSYFENSELECYKGPEFELLNHQQRNILLTKNFTISNNNRMGYRLNEIISNSLSSILTSAVLVGTVQLTPSGKLIVLMRDCQVTGGYPRILQLSEKSINRLSQKKMSQNIYFTLKNCLS